MRVNDERDAPTPQQLAAYLDGELDAAARARVADWLARHPDAAADLAAQRTVQRACTSTPPPEPAETAWDAALKRIDERTQVIKAAKRRQAQEARRALLRRAGSVGVAAAMLLLALLLHRPATQKPDAPAAAQRLRVAADEDVEIVRMDPRDRHFLTVGVPPHEPLGPAPAIARMLVAADEDVEIISIDAGDIRSLAVGLPPLHGPFVLAAPGDVALEKIEQDSDGMVPKMNMDDGPGAPMIVAPLALARDR